MKPASAATALLFAICLAMLSACGGDNGDNELEQALRSVTENDLAIMVLPQEDLGEEFAGLEIEDDSGFSDSEEAADGTIDPDDTAEDLEQAGRINGYELSYSDPVLSALEAGVGVIEVTTEVDLFRDAGAASDHLAKQVSDWQQLEGEEIEAGLTLEKVEKFAVDGLADEAVGLRGRVSFAEVQFYQTVVAFRLDRLVGAARLAEKAGVIPEALSWGIAAGYCFDDRDDPLAVALQERIAAEGFDAVLADVSSIEPDEPLAALVREHSSKLRQGLPCAPPRPQSKGSWPRPLPYPLIRAGTGSKDETKNERPSHWNRLLELYPPGPAEWIAGCGVAIHPRVVRHLPGCDGNAFDHGNDRLYPV